MEVTLCVCARACARIFLIFYDFSAFNAFSAYMQNKSEFLTSIFNMEIYIYIYHRLNFLKNTPSFDLCGSIDMTLAGILSNLQRIVIKT